MVDTPQIKTKMTAAEFMALPESDERIELIHGEIVASSSAKDPHQRASVKTIQLFGRLDLGGELQAEIDLHIGNSVLRPDLFWVSEQNSNCHVGEDGYWHGVPDLVIEIVSPSTELRDRGVKFELYEAAGLREYWLLDPIANFIEVYVHENGKFAHYGVCGPDATFESPALSQQAIDVSAILGQATEA